MILCPPMEKLVWQPMWENKNSKFKPVIEKGINLMTLTPSMENKCGNQYRRIKNLKSSSCLEIYKSKYSPPSN